MPPKGRGRKGPAVEDEFIDPDEEMAAAEEELPILRADTLLQQLTDIDVSNFVMPPKPNNAYKDGGKRRMIILHMEVRNFKSYYGKVTIGPFHPHFSCIVGANGSGKSNIIDALLFVFGFKASRIRSHKIESLIHKSARHPNERECSVKVKFGEVEDLPDGTHDFVPNTEFSVGRGVKLSERGAATSSYHFNGRPVSMTELQKLLAERGIDLEYNRFLILQGEVELISTLKPKALTPKDQGLLEYLEDVIGTNRYQEKVNQIELLLKNVNQTAQAQAERVTKAAARKTENIIPVRDMLKLLMLHNRIAHAEWRINSVHLNKAIKASEKYRSELTEVEEQLVEKKARFDEVVSANKKSKSAVKKLESELNTTKVSHRDLKTRHENLQLQLKKACTAVQNAEKRATAREKAHQTDLEKVAKLKGVPENKLAEAEALRIELAEVKEKRDTLRKQVDEKNAAARDETTHVEGERTEIGGRLANLKRKDGQLKAQIELAENNLKSQSEPLEEAKVRYESGEAELEAKEQENEQRQDKLKEASSRTADLEKHYQILKSRIAELESREKPAAIKFKECQIAYNGASKERSDKAATIESNNVFMAEKRSGRIPGICGRLGDLGHIDARYDLAVSSNFRGGLNTIIIEDSQTLNKCLEFVANNRLGRTSFMPFEKMRNDWNRPFRNQGFPRLYDAIEPLEPRFGAAFHYFLRDTLVCDDIETARRVARSSGLDVATVDGNIVKSTGVLTGGGSNSRSHGGAMGIKSASSHAAATRQNVPTMSDAEINELKRQLDEADRVLRSIRKELDAARLEAGNVEQKLQTERTLKQRMEKEDSVARQHVNFLRQNLVELKQQYERAELAAKDTSKTEDLKKQILTLSKERDGLKDQIAQVQEEHDEISARIKRIYSEIAGGEQEAFDAAEARLKELDKKITDLRKAAKKAETELDQCRANIDVADKAIAELRAEIDKLIEKRDDMEQAVEALAESAQTEAAKVKELQEALTAETAKAEADDVEEVTLNREIGALKERQNKATGKLESYDRTIAEKKKELEGLKLHAIQDLLAEADRDDDDKMDCSDEIDDVDDFDDNDFDDDDENDFVEQFVAVEEPEPTEYEPDGSNDHRHLSFKELTVEQCESLDMDFWKDHLRTLQGERDRIKTPLNMRILEDFRERIEEHKEEERLLKEIRGKAKIFNEAGNTLLAQRTQEFNDAMKIISNNFKKQYYDLSLGGESDICVPNGGDPYTEGIHMVVRPQNKGWRDITQISGGEKTIASLSLVFALHQYQPTPFYVMDEIDAALDFRNVSMISRLVKEKTKNSQFIIISLRNNMQQAANRIIGVNKVKDCARVLAFEYEASSEALRKAHNRWETSLVPS
uniref:Structural maintenance of chromosomes protein n=1 Tax=Panagrellus redivivus TaxID=6233 RepID=A0A7E4ZZW8_PANRE